MRWDSRVLGPGSVSESHPYRSSSFEESDARKFGRGMGFRRDQTRHSCKLLPRYRIMLAVIWCGSHMSALTFWKDLKLMGRVGYDVHVFPLRLVQNIWEEWECHVREGPSRC